MKDIQKQIQQHDVIFQEYNIELVVYPRLSQPLPVLEVLQMILQRTLLRVTKANWQEHYFCSCGPPHKICSLHAVGTALTTIKAKIFPDVVFKFH